MKQLERRFNDFFRIFHQGQSTFEVAREFSGEVLRVFEEMKPPSGRISFPSVAGLEFTWWGNVEPTAEGIEYILNSSGISLRELSELIKLSRNRVIGASFFGNPTIFVLSHEVLYWASRTYPQDYGLHLVAVSAVGQAVDIQFSYVPVVEDF